MKPLCASITLAATLVGAPAQAGTQVNAQLFSAEYRYSDYSPQMSILSDDGDTVRLALSGVGADEMDGGIIDRQSSGGSSELPEYYETMMYAWNGTYLSFDVKQGYRVESFTLSGKVTGSLSPGRLPADTAPRDVGAYGSASDWSRWNLETAAGRTRGGRLDNITGTQEFSVRHDDSATGEFTLTLSHEVDGSLWSAYRWVERGSSRYVEYFPSTGTLDVSDVVLTVQLAPIAAVPEPTTWAMLLGGLALVGCGARRRRK